MTKETYDIRLRISVFFISIHFVAFPSVLSVPCLAITSEIEASNRREPHSEWEQKLQPLRPPRPFDLSLPLRKERSLSWLRIQTVKGNEPREEHLSDKWLIKNTFSPLRPPLPRHLPPPLHKLYGGNLSVIARPRPPSRSDYNLV